MIEASIDLAGTRELLDRLQLSLDFQVHTTPVPNILADFGLATTVGNLDYWRSADDSFWIGDRVTGAVAHLVARSAQSGRVVSIAVIFGIRL